jgi:phospholipase A1
MASFVFLTRCSNWHFAIIGAVWALGSCGALSAIAQTAEPSPGNTPTTLGHCAQIGAPADRLACYDKLAGRAAAPTVPPAQEALPSGTVPPASTSALEQKDAPVAPTTEPTPASSLMSKFWELDSGDKRGIFNFVGYQPNYVLPLHVTNHINRSPHSPTEVAVQQPDFRNAEAKFQLSLRTKVLQDVLFPQADLWLAYTQEAMWQLYDGRDSSPFRNTDYQPEMIYIVPTPKTWRELPLGWQWRYTQLGLAHESNGQSDPLSRSWNRYYLGTGFERGDWSLSGRFTQRINESIADDNNPDLVDFRGRGEFQLNWAHGLQTASLMIRSTLSSIKAAQFEWSYPVSRDQPNGLRWFFQAFTGYGETLTDYNFHQTSVGIGVTFLQF